MKQLLASFLACASIATPAQGYWSFEGAVRVESGPIVEDPCFEMRGSVNLVRGRVDDQETYYADIDNSGSIDVIIGSRPTLGDELLVRATGPAGTAYERGLLIGDSHLSELVTERSPREFERLEERFTRADDVYRTMVAWLAPLDRFYDGTCDPNGFFFDPAPEFISRK